MASKRQTTMAKFARERRVLEKRARKQEKKQAVAAAKVAEATGSAPGGASESEASPQSD
ncbi:MAG TPA: hypothetical protein VGQ84_06600 [Gaiellaceae bacterium]|nr:hypothetical protein [Gaiellaceae bacterium]